MQVNKLVVHMKFQLSCGWDSWRMFRDLIFPCQSGSYTSPSGLLQSLLCFSEPKIPVPSWLVRHLPRIQQEWGKLASFGHVKAKKLSASGGFAPDPLIRGSAPGPRWRQSSPLTALPPNPHYRLALAIFSPKRMPLNIRDPPLDAGCKNRY